MSGDADAGSTISKYQFSLLFSVRPDSENTMKRMENSVNAIEYRSSGFPSRLS